MTIDCTKINVKNGTSGAMVTEVQKYLKYYGYYDANIDGSCGNYTVEAIKKFQKANGLVVDGIFGTISCQKSNINGNDISNTTRELKLSVWKDIMNRYNNYIINYKTEPTKCYINKEYPYEYITNVKYKDIKARYDAWIKSNNSEPAFVYVTKPTTSTTSTSTTSTTKKTVYVSSPYCESSGAGCMGQTNSYRCGPHSICQCMRKLGITKYSEPTIAGYAGTTTSGTGHDGLNTAIAKIALLEKITLKVQWLYFSDLGETTKERFEALAQINDQKNKAAFIHSQYRYGESNSGKGFGHYEVNKTVDLNNSSTVVLNSLGNKCTSTGYCGYKETRGMSKWQTYINHTCGGQPSVCVITKT